MTILRPLLVEAGVKTVGKVVLGTVHGDLHDIGKNLVGMMLEGAGFEVVDLGTDVQPQQFVDAVKQHHPDIVGMSALLTTTTKSMPMTITALTEAGLREPRSKLSSAARRSPTSLPRRSVRMASQPTPAVQPAQPERLIDVA